MIDHHRESRSRIANFKADVVDLWTKHDLSTSEYLAALAALTHDIAARILASDRGAAWEKAQKKNRKKVKA